MPKTGTSARISPGAAADEEVRFFSQLHSLIPLTDTVRGIEFRLGEDSDGAPAVWFTIRAKEDNNPSESKITELSLAAKKLRAAVFDSDFNRWPYVQIKTE